MTEKSLNEAEKRLLDFIYKRREPDTLEHFRDFVSSLDMFLDDVEVSAGMTKDVMDVVDKTRAINNILYDQVLCIYGEGMERKPDAYLSDGMRHVWYQELQDILLDLQELFVCMKAKCVHMTESENLFLLVKDLIALYESFVWKRV